MDLFRATNDIFLLPCSLTVAEAFPFDHIKMIDLDIQIKTAHVGQINVIIGVLHKPFTISVIIKPIVVEFSWIKLLKLLFCGNVFSFFLSKEDVSFIELLHIQVILFLLDLIALGFLLTAWAIISILLAWLNLFGVRSLVLILLLWGSYSTCKLFIRNRFFLLLLLAQLILFNVDINPFFYIHSSLLLILFWNHLILIDLFFFLQFFFLLFNIKIGHLSFQLNISLLIKMEPLIM